MKEQNPLQQYYRSEKIWITLPSGTSYYNDDLITFNDSGEVGIMAMTARDEILAKNPDALLNGDAISNIIASCVPNVKDPKSLITNDIDALMLAIRHATYGDDIEIETKCPECDVSNTFTVSLSNSIAGMGKLESEYNVDMENGASIFVRPFIYKQSISALKIQFEQYKAGQAFENTQLTDDQRLKMFSKSYEKIAETNLELLSDCIIKVIAGGVEVTNPAHIKEFMTNVDKTTFHNIEDLIGSINDIGVIKKFDATCQKCDHTWETSIDFNPVTFFTES